MAYQLTWGAEAPRATVQQRTSFSPAVKKYICLSSLYPHLIIRGITLPLPILSCEIISAAPGTQQVSYRYVVECGQSWSIMTSNDFCTGLR